MATTPAIKTLLRREVLRALKEDIVYYVQDGDTGNCLSPDAIVLQKTSARRNRQGESTNQLMDFPGLILSMPRRTTIPPEGGTNERDDWTHEFLIQLIDKDSWDEENRMASREKWIEQIASLFNHRLEQFSSVIVEDDLGACLVAVVAMSVDDIDEGLWAKHSEFVSGVHLMIIVRQPRGVIS